MAQIAVVVPVGPEQHHAQWLDECLQSVAEQTLLAPDALVVVDDMHGLGGPEVRAMFRTAGPVIEVYCPPWRLGVGHAFNHGVARAFVLGADVALMLGADDTIEPGVLAALDAEYERQGGRDGWYWLDVLYSDGEEQRLPCNAAAVTPGFMRRTGGLPVEASAGGMDAALVSALLVHWPEALIHVSGEQARYVARRHANQEGARLNAYAAGMGPIRETFTREFHEPQWGRYE